MKMQEILAEMEVFKCGLKNFEKPSKSFKETFNNSMDFPMFRMVRVKEKMDPSSRTE